MSKASNMPIPTSKCRCNNCGKPFYELVNHKLKQCPWCNHIFSDPNSFPNMEGISDKYNLVINPQNGVPSIMVLGGIEKLVQDNRAIQLELEQERHFVNGILRVRKVLRRKYHAEKARADAAE
ncbi:hypothetical protein, partial [Paenibacillus larvae]